MNIDIELDNIMQNFMIEPYCCKLNRMINGDSTSIDEYKEISSYLENYFTTDSEDQLCFIIYKYISIRDFRNAFKYIDEYLEKYNTYSDRLKKLKECLLIFFKRIKEELSKNNNNPIAMCWIDSVQYDEVQEFPFLSNMRDNSLCLDNAYTVMPYTIPTFWTLFCQKMPVEDGYHNYRYEHITKDNSNVLRYLEDKGYTFIYHGNSLELFGIEKENTRHKNFTEFEMGDNKNSINEILKETTMNLSEDICPLVLWNGLRTIVSGEKSFSLLYMVLETHTPYIAGNITREYVCDQYEPKVEQIACAREYIDGQLEFYWNIWKDCATTIFMSDHGKLVEGKKQKIYRDLQHTMMMINGKLIKKKRVKDMFSYIDFFDVVKICVEPNKPYSINKRDYVPIENLDVYGRLVFMRMIDEDDKNISKDCLLGYRGVRTQNETFLVRNDGKKYYYKKPCLQNLYGVDRSDELEQKYNVFFVSPLIDIWNNSFYKHTQKIYKAIERHDNRVAELQNEAEKLLKELFLSFGENEVIALRGGGASAYEIIKTVGNIKYIIDMSISSSEGWPGCEYIRPEQIDDKGISTILITSYDYRKQMKEELQSLEDHIRVIDLNEYFEGHGLVLKEDYRADKVSVMDIKEFFC